MKERFGIGEAFTRLEAGEVVICHIPERYPLALKLVDFVLMERVIGTWYHCRKGAQTLAAARFWTTDAGERDEEWKPDEPPPTVEERLARIEQFIGEPLLKGSC